MVIAIAALYQKFEEGYLEWLKTVDSHYKKHPELAKEAFFRKRRNGEYEMIGVQNGWLCFKMGYVAAGGEIHDES